MSQGRKYRHEVGVDIAHAVKSALEGTLTLYLAGSLRRDEAVIGDVDLVATRNPPHFAYLDRLTRPGLPWSVENKDLSRESKLIKLLWTGPQAQGLKVQIFLADPEALGWILMLRTGPEDFGKELVNVVKPWGFEFSNARLCKLTEAGDLLSKRTEAVPIPTPTEKSLFDAIGIAFIPPNRRSRRTLQLACADRRIPAPQRSTS